MSDRKTRRFLVILITCWTLHIVLGQKPCSEISEYGRSLTSDNCPGNQVELCRWVEVSGRWEEATIGNEPYVRVSMSGYSEPANLTTKNAICPTSAVYSFGFQYYMENRSNCDLALILQSAGGPNLLWNSSWSDNTAAAETVLLTNATSKDSEFKLVFSATKRNRYSCSFTVWSNFMGVRDIGYSALATTTTSRASPTSPISSTATASTAATSGTSTDTVFSSPTPQATTAPGTVSAVSPASTATISTAASSFSQHPSGPGTPQSSSSTSASPTHTSMKTKTEDDETSNTGVIAGVVVGIMAVFVVVIILIVLLRRKGGGGLKWCPLVSKLKHKRPTAPSTTNSVLSRAPSGQGAYELADATYLQEYANLRPARPMVDEHGYQIPVEPQRSQRHQEHTTDESCYSSAHDEEAGNYYSVPDDSASINNPSGATACTYGATGCQSKGDNIYELADDTETGRTCVLTEDTSYDKLSQTGAKPRPAHIATHSYDHIENVMPTTTRAETGEYSLARTDDTAHGVASYRKPVSSLTAMPRKDGDATYNHLNEVSQNTAAVSGDAHEYSVARAEDRGISNAAFLTEPGHEYSLARTEDSLSSSTEISNRLQAADSNSRLTQNKKPDDAFLNSARVMGPYASPSGTHKVPQLLHKSVPSPDTSAVYSLARTEDFENSSSANASYYNTREASTKPLSKSEYHTLDFGSNKSEEDSTKANAQSNQGSSQEQYHTLDFGNAKSSNTKTDDADFGNTKSSNAAQRVPQKDGYSQVIKPRDRSQPSNSEEDQSVPGDERQSAVYHILEEEK